MAKKRKPKMVPKWVEERNDGTVYEQSEEMVPVEPKKRKLTGSGAMTAPQHPDCKAGSLEEGKVAVNRSLNQELVEALAKDIKEGRIKVAGLGPSTVGEIGYARLRQVYEEQCRGVPNPLPFDQWLDRIIAKQPSVEGPKPVEPQNIVQWLGRDPVTGDDRLRIALAEGEDREYLVFDQLHLPVRVLHLQYLKDMVPITRSVLFDKNDGPIGCTCPDHTERKRVCKHMRALKAAIGSRPRPITFT